LSRTGCPCAAVETATSNNLAKNGLFTDLRLSTVPDHWTKSGTGATVAEVAAIGLNGRLHV
jgi:hypothetical protein